MFNWLFAMVLALGLSLSTLGSAAALGSSGVPCTHDGAASSAPDHGVAATGTNHTGTQTGESAPPCPPHSHDCCAAGCGPTFLLFAPPAHAPWFVKFAAFEIAASRPETITTDILAPPPKA